MRKHNQDGFSFVEVLIVLVILAVIGFVGFRVLSGKQEGSSLSPENGQTAKLPSGEEVAWNFDESAKKWVVTKGEAPDCPEPLFSMSPTNVQETSAVLYPGQYRNKDYKAHGGFGFSKPNAINHEVVMPFDATLTGLTRYIEIGELQYIVDFVHPCGVAIRFDHLRELSPELQAIAETTPEPKENSTQNNHKLSKTVTLKAGDKVATSVGFTVFEGTGFDFGVYDYRQRNSMSRNDTWRQLHEQFPAQHWYGVCWFGLLPQVDQDHIKALKPINPNAPPEVSDYCPGAPGGTTLDHNGGKPE